MQSAMQLGVNGYLRYRYSIRMRIIRNILASAQPENCEAAMGKMKKGPVKGPFFIFSGGVIALALRAQLCRPAAPVSECTVPTARTRLRLK
jgi:hypothetical protein